MPRIFTMVSTLTALGLGLQHDHRSITGVKGVEENFVLLLVSGSAP